MGINESEEIYYVYVTVVVAPTIGFAMVMS